MSFVVKNFLTYIIAVGGAGVGTAFTVRYRPCGMVKGTVGDFLDDVQPGQVVVLDNGGRRYGTVWGDIMTVYAQKRGVAGTVIDGVCRVPFTAAAVFVHHQFVPLVRMLTVRLPVAFESQPT